MFETNKSNDARKWLSGFSCYLRQFGYNPTSEDSYRAFRMLDMTADDDDIDDILALFLAKTEEQVRMLPYHRAKFDSRTEQKIQEHKDSIDTLQQTQRQEQSTFDRQREQLLSKRRQAQQEATDKFWQGHNGKSQDIDLPLTREDLELVSPEQRELIEALSQAANVGGDEQEEASSGQKQSEECADTGKGKQQSSNKSNDKSVNKETLDIEAVKCALAEAMTNALWKGDLEATGRLDASIKELDNAKNHLNALKLKLAKVKEEVSAPFDKQIEDLQKSAREAQKKLESEISRKQLEINKMMKAERELDTSMNSALKIKTASSSYRTEDDFSSFTQCFDSGSIDKSLTSLSKEEYKSIYNVLCRNATSLYTRMTRNIRTKLTAKVNMSRTIKQACKTGGVPYKIVREKPKPSKAKMVLVLDISGSCSAASKMMLTLMHALSSVFPRGVKVYVFVNRLYDVSDIMSINNVHSAIENVFKLVPTRGVYSDYNEPLRSLWEDHRQDFTRETMCVFIGDARNNRNPSGEEYAKNIARKSKRAYWLNTEPMYQWDTGDSIAGIYKKYMKMIPVLTAHDIVKFIEDMR